jgi:hypothetical protein
MITEYRAPSDLFRRLIETLFDLIDKNFEPKETRRLEPEKCRVVMTMLDYTGEDNPFWYFRDLGERNGLGISWSDGEITFIYRQYSWEYEVATRSFEQQVGSIPQELHPFFTPVSRGMPLLTRNGFRDMLVADALADPTQFYDRFNKLIHRAWEIQRLIDPATGKEFPREEIPLIAWPMGPDPDALRMKDVVQEACRHRAGQE